MSGYRTLEYISRNFSEEISRLNPKEQWANGKTAWTLVLALPYGGTASAGPMYPPQR